MGSRMTGTTLHEVARPAARHPRLLTKVAADLTRVDQDYFFGNRTAFQTSPAVVHAGATRFKHLPVIVLACRIVGLDYSGSHSSRRHHQLKAHEDFCIDGDDFREEPDYFPAVGTPLVTEP